MKKIIIWLFLLSSICWAKPAFLTWYDLMEYDLETNTLSTNLNKSLQKPIKVVGFIVPLLDDLNFDKISEFYLVPDPMMCIHIPPPPPNQLIHVKMKKPIPLDIDFEGVWIEGKLEPIKNPIDEQPGYTLIGTKAWACDDYPFDELLDPLSELIDFDSY